MRNVHLLLLLLFVAYNKSNAQTVKLQQGLLYKAGTGIRLGGIQIIDKQSRLRTQSNAYGIFNIAAAGGDTLLFTGERFQPATFVITDFTDKVIYLDPVIQLDEVVVKERSLQSEIREVQRGYREKSVFYTGTPHYYYLVLKPMTFIYENFKSEVKEARHFNRYARKEMALYKVTSRFNDTSIKKVIPIKDEQLSDFELSYMPTLKQIESRNDYDLINYIKNSYVDFRKKIKNTSDI